MDERKDKDFYLTTSDNPYNYFDDYERWERYDIVNGYNTNSRIARVVGVYSIGVPDEVAREDWRGAMESIYSWHLPMVNKYGETIYYVKCYDNSGDSE